MPPRSVIGNWTPTENPPSTTPTATRAVLADLSAPIVVVETPAGLAVASRGRTTLGEADAGAFPLLGLASALPLTALGDASFLTDYGIQYPYMTGAMANGIASVEVVEAISRAGMLGSFGAAGLSVERVTQAIERLQSTLDQRPFAVNLIHSPNEPAHEAAIADLLLRKGVRFVEASAYLDLTPPIVRYRLAGLNRRPDGRIHIQNRVIAKVSRVEVATKFLSPAPARIVAELLAAGQITAEQAELGQEVPMCDDLTAEADSGGHTDNRPAITLLPTLLALKERLRSSVRVGLAGGIATPASVAAAFALGASYVVTGSVNQACIESGSSTVVRKMLAEAGQADVTMAPAADMFEMGVKVQVLKRGTMFAMRGQKLFDVYRAYSSWDAIPEPERANIEKNILRQPFEAVWAETESFFRRRDPAQLTRAEADAKHKMALVFRWYLGLSSRWANSGQADRQLDFQVWCGPAMGAFNEWTAGSFLAQPENRSVVLVAKNLLYGAAIHLRRQALRQQGIELPAEWWPRGPWTESELTTLITGVA